MKAAFACFFFLALATAPSVEDPQIYVRRLESAYKHARTLEAEFLQVYSESDRITRSEAGTAYFRRPGKMRWEYVSPEKNLFVVDGKFAWFYVPADHTASRVATRESSDWRTPLALLAGEMKVSRVCSKVAMAVEQPQSSDLARIDCAIRGTEKETKTGKPHDIAYFEIAKATGELRRVVVTGPGGVRMDMQFSHWKFDPPAADELFHFQPPKGVAIVDGDELMAGPGQTLQ
jgi:outer membrane lipoprotein carrier protein